MSRIKTYSVETDAYWNIIKNAADEVKLRLITLLSQSLISNGRESIHSDKEKTESFLSKYCGAWHGNESAEEIIGGIKSVRTCKEPISFD